MVDLSGWEIEVVEESEGRVTDSYGRAEEAGVRVRGRLSRDELSQSLLDCWALWGVKWSIGVTECSITEWDIQEERVADLELNACAVLEAYKCWIAREEILKLRMRDINESWLLKQSSIESRSWDEVQWTGSRAILVSVICVRAGAQSRIKRGKRRIINTLNFPLISALGSHSCFRAESIESNALDSERSGNSESEISTHEWVDCDLWALHYFRLAADVWVSRFISWDSRTGERSRIIKSLL